MVVKISGKKLYPN